MGIKLQLIAYSASAEIRLFADLN